MWAIDLGGAIEAAGSEAFDVVLLDLTLPDASGLETFTTFVAALAARPPVIVLTGLTDRDLATQAVTRGAQDFLVKQNVEREVLARSIRYAIERHRATDELERALARERDMVEKLQELDRLKNRFVAMASHELRTPLASIAGFATTLRDRWTQIRDEDRHKYIAIIDDQSTRLARLVDDLLVLSRIESGSLDARPEPVALDGAIQLVVRELEAQQVRIDVPEWLRVRADRDHLEQMLMNYVSNALKYGEAPFTVETRVRGHFVDILVKDEGAGVPADMLPLLFEEFARARAHTEARIVGTGLGLSIVRGLARAQGGDAWYRANEPRGAIFGLSLPTVNP